jgi:hypothetical protein
VDGDEYKDGRAIHDLRLHLYTLPFRVFMSTTILGLS